MDDYQAYLRQIVLEFERLIKSGATNILEEYGKVIQSMFWAVKANKQTILNGADPVEVLASVPDARCKAWRLKLSGKTAIDPTTLVEGTEIGPQKASDVMNLKPQEIFELVEDKLVGKTKEQVNIIKKCIGNICREQALAHRHVAEAAENMASLTELVSRPILLKVISATMRPTVAIKIPEVDEMMARAEQKVDQTSEAESWRAETNRRGGVCSECTEVQPGVGALTERTSHCLPYDTCMPLHARVATER